MEATFGKFDIHHGCKPVRIAEENPASVWLLAETDKVGPRAADQARPETESSSGKAHSGKGVVSRNMNLPRISGFP